MTVKVTKPAINLREKLSELESNKNIDASALTTGTLPVDRVPYVGRRNLIINGGFDVWQRGTSQTAIGFGSADRFIMANATSYAQSSEAPDGFIYSLRVAGVTGTNTWNYNLRQKLENSYYLLSTNDFTVSFYIKGDSSYTGYVDVSDNQSQSFDVTTSWTRVSKQFTALTAQGPYGVNDFVDICVPTSGASYYVTGVQLELGSVATPFEHRSYGEELALCKRYYEVVSYNSTGAYGDIWSKPLNTFTNCWTDVRYTVEKRAIPTFSLVNGATWSTDYSLDPVAQLQNKTSIVFNSGGFYYLTDGSGGNPMAVVDAEL